MSASALYRLRLRILSLLGKMGLEISPFPPVLFANSGSALAHGCGRDGHVGHAEGLVMIRRLGEVGAVSSGRTRVGGGYFGERIHITGLAWCGEGRVAEARRRRSSLCSEAGKDGGRLLLHGRRRERLRGGRLRTTEAVLTESGQSQGASKRV